MQLNITMYLYLFIYFQAHHLSIMPFVLFEESIEFFASNANPYKTHEILATIYACTQT